MPRRRRHGSIAAVREPARERSSCVRAALLATRVTARLVLSLSSLSSSLTTLSAAAAVSSGVPRGSADLQWRVHKKPLYAFVI